MDMRMLKAISVICAISFANIASSNPLCSLKDGPGKKAIKINELPGYFFKVHPSGKYLSYIGPGANMIVNLETGVQHKSLGEVDPVWSPDGKFLTFPGKEGGMEFHHGEAIIKASVDGTPEQSTPIASKLEGVYQSIGINGDGYRMVTDADGATISEYTFDQEGPKVGPEPTKVCGNIPDFPTDLPMLSKDAKYLAVYDQSSKSTKIFNVSATDCSLALDLGFPTGKVSFNQNSSQISFHMDQFAEFENGYFSGISKDKVKNVVVMNLTSSDNGQKLRPIAWSLVSNHTNSGDGGYYPDFDKEGNIYHLEDVNNFFQFVKTSQDDLEFVDFEVESFLDYSGCEACLTKQKSPMEVLALLWSSVCKTETKIDMSRANILAMAMNPEACLQMVGDFWTESLGVTKEALINTCPKKKSNQKEVLGTWDLEREITSEKLIQSQCIMCHTKPMDIEKGKYSYISSTAPGKYEPLTYEAKKHVEAFTDLNNLSAVTINQMGMAVMDGSMPKGSTMTDPEKEMVQSFLNRKLLDLPGEQRGQNTQVVFSYSEEDVEKELVTVRKEYADHPEYLEEQLLATKCQYNQIHCQAYLDFQIPRIHQNALAQPEAERETYLKNTLMNVKCVNFGGASLNECREWQEQQPEE